MTESPRRFAALPPFTRGAVFCSIRPLVKGGWQRRKAMTGGFLRKGSQPFGVPLIRHGCAVPPSPRGRLFVSYPRSGCRGGYHPPGVPCYAPLGSLVKGSWHGVAVTEGFRSPRPKPSPSQGADSPCQGEMSRRDKRDREGGPQGRMRVSIVACGGHRGRTQRSAPTDNLRDTP